MTEEVGARRCDSVADLKVFARRLGVIGSEADGAIELAYLRGVQSLPPPPDAPAVTDEMVVLDEATVEKIVREHFYPGPVVGSTKRLTAALLAALQPPDQ